MIMISNVKLLEAVPSLRVTPRVLSPLTTGIVKTMLPVEVIATHVGPDDFVKVIGLP